MTISVVRYFLSTASAMASTSTRISSSFSPSAMMRISGSVPDLRTSMLSFLTKFVLGSGFDGILHVVTLQRRITPALKAHVVQYLRHRGKEIADLGAWILAGFQHHCKRLQRRHDSIPRRRIIA